MMGFNNIIGHEEIIGHLKNAIEEKYRILIFLPANQVLVKSSSQGLLRQHFSVRPEVQNPARNATPAKRRWVRIIRTLLWSVMRNPERSQLTRSEIR